jgi:hypothetical protein
VSQKKMWEENVEKIWLLAALVFVGCTADKMA